MGAPLLSPSRRLRRTPFSEGVEAAGVKAYTVYNHMLLPTVFRSVEEDYHHLKEAVQVWDVACERQVELRGPDAARGTRERRANRVAADGAAARGLGDDPEIAAIGAVEPGIVRGRHASPLGTRPAPSGVSSA